MNKDELNNILQQHKLWAENGRKKGCRANLAGVNLTGANLQGAELQGANLTGADLTGADLTGADLKDANLSFADLVGANLTSTNLQGANLIGANLSGANLSGANLQGANLTGANLTGADLTGAYLQRAILKDARGLPDISWIKSGCLVELNHVIHDFCLKQESKYENFIQDSFGMIIQENLKEKTFDILVEDRIIRNIPEWVKYSGMKQKQV